MDCRPLGRLREAGLVIVIGAALLALRPGAGGALAPRTWTGSTSTSWSATSNWNPAGTPSAGDQLSFPATASTLTSNSDLTGVDVDSVAITAAYTITGNAFAIDTALTLSGASASIANPLTLGGNLTITVTGGSSVLTLSGGINLAGHNLTFAGDGTLLAGNISGTGSVTKNGSGTVELHGYGTYSGSTTINAGTLRAATDMTNACAGIAGATRLPAAGTVVAGAGALLDLQCPVTIGGLSGAGEARTEAASVILTIAANTDTTFSGVISGPGGLAINGSSPIAQYGPTLTGISTYTGPTTVTGGGIGLAGGSIASSSSLALSGGGAIGGTGNAPMSTFADALLFPGILGTPGQLTVPSLTMALQTTARFVLANTDLASYDRVIVSGGAVTLGNAMLDLRTVLGFDPPVGSQYTLIGGASSVTGIFATLPEGATFNVGIRRYSITYKGGAGGHDIVVTRLTAPPADLSVTKSASNASMTPGGTLTFTITAANAGPNDAPFPSVTDTLSAGFLFQSVTAPPGWTCGTPGVGNAGQVGCQATTFPQNTTATFSIGVTVAPSASGNITNSAAISSGAADQVTTNNSASVTVLISISARPYVAFAPEIAADGQ